MKNVIYDILNIGNENTKQNVVLSLVFSFVISLMQGRVDAGRILVLSSSPKIFSVFFVSIFLNEKS